MALGVAVLGVASETTRQAIDGSGSTRVVYMGVWPDGWRYHDRVSSLG